MPLLSLSIVQLIDPSMTKALPAPQLILRNQRVREYIQLVHPIACFYAHCSPEPVDDLEQVGLLGLLRAAELFDAESQTPFGAFARPHIRGAILHYLRDHGQSIRLPRRLLELKDQINRHGLQHLHNRSLSAGDQRRIQEIAAWRRPLSLDAVLEEGISIPASSDRDQDPEAMGSEALDLLKHLEPQLQQVVRHVVLGGWSYRRTAQRLHVSPMTVQRRLKRGLGLLRCSLDRSGLNQAIGLHPVASAAPGC